MDEKWWWVKCAVRVASKVPTAAPPREELDSRFRGNDVHQEYALNPVIPAKAGIHRYYRESPASRT